MDMDQTSKNESDQTRMKVQVLFDMNTNEVCLGFVSVAKCCTEMGRLAVVESWQLGFVAV